jgi:hypothetical protein
LALWKHEENTGKSGLTVLNDLQGVVIKGSRKNNFTFWHLIFRSFLAAFEEQKP